MRRRQILIAGTGYVTLLAAAPALVLAPPLAPPARAEADEIYDDDRVLGSADAKVEADVSYTVVAHLKETSGIQLSIFVNDFEPNWRRYRMPPRIVERTDPLQLMLLA